MTTDDGSKGTRMQVDENLRRVFERTLSEDLPDRFKILIDELRARDSDGRSDTNK